MLTQRGHGAMSRRLRMLVVVALCCVTAVSAQPRAGLWGRPDLRYDGRLTFARLRWTRGTFGAPPAGMGINMWLHEFPRAEQNLMSVLGDFTLVDANTDGSLILPLDDPDLFKHPIAMLWEPGFWVMTDEQAERLRAYMLKGGFIIFNDFEVGQWDNFEAQLKRVLPDVQLMRLDETHPIFNSFFRVDQIDAPNPINHHLGGFTPEYFGVFEDNDPTGPLMAIVNYNTNLGEYWQLAGTGLLPFEAENTGFQIGLNYMMYGLTH